MSTRPPAVVGPQAWFSAAARVQMSPQPRGSIAHSDCRDRHGSMVHGHKHDSRLRTSNFLSSNSRHRTSSLSPLRALFAQWKVLSPGISSRKQLDSVASMKPGESSSFFLPRKEKKNSRRLGKRSPYIPERRGHLTGTFCGCCCLLQTTPHPSSPTLVLGQW